MTLHPAHAVELETSQSPTEGMGKTGTMEGGEKGPGHDLGSEGWEFPHVIQPLDICVFGGHTGAPGGSHM